MRFTGILLLALASAGSVPQTGHVKLHLVSYNIKGLPGIMTGADWKNERYAIIGRILNERSPDVVFLQEAFSDNTRALFRAAGFPHMAQGPEYKTWVGLDSGLYILSRYPIVKTAVREFKAHPNCSGFDCFANKGMQFARIQIPGLPKPVDVFNTHLQAGRESPPARARQVKMLIEFFREHHGPGNPVFFGGDFNLRPLRDREVYDEFVQSTGLTNSGKVCLERGCARSPDTGWQGIWENAVDHQFYSATGTIKISPLRVERTLHETVEGYRLSDHLAHEVQFELRF